MYRLLTINANNFEPKDYTTRNVVRAVILDESKTKVLFFGGIFVGGGVEEGETDEEALVREAMEEVGATIDIIQPLGEIIAYRDFLKKKYIVHGYLCMQKGECTNPTSTDTREQGIEATWLDIPAAIEKLESEIDALETQYASVPKDELFQKRSYNRRISLVFLKEL